MGKSKTSKWESFKLRLRIEDVLILDEAAVKSIAKIMSKLVDAMREAVNGDFVLSLHITTQGERDAELVEELNKQDLADLSVGIDVKQRPGKKDTTETRILVVNTDNSMCGYTERWMFECKTCNQWSHNVLG